MFLYFNLIYFILIFSLFYFFILFLRLDDFDNSCAAYEKSIEIDQDYVTHLNYAITLLANDEVERATAQFGKYELSVTKIPQGDVDPDVMRQAELVRLALGET